MPNFWFLGFSALTGGLGYVNCGHQIWDEFPLRQHRSLREAGIEKQRGK